MNEFATSFPKYGHFVVRNVTPDRQKSIKIFANIIKYNKTKDLLQIPGIGEADIRASLLKGELLHKILIKDIIIEASDIDLLQFNNDQKKFLQDSGIFDGTSISYYNFTTARKDDIILIGTIDGSNKIFSTSDYFVQDVLYKIIVYLNGVKQLYLDDYFIAESLGPGSGYNTVIFTAAPPLNSVATADYYIKI